jgi:egghead protein (zeste-white 4 protein)
MQRSSRSAPSIALGVGLAAALLLLQPFLPHGAVASLTSATGPICPQPSITAVGTAPDAGSGHSATPRQAVHVVGGGFIAPSCTLTVSIGSVAVTPAAVTATGFTVGMPAGPGGAVVATLTDVLGNATANSPRFVIAGVASGSGLSPATVSPGSSITVYGTDFSVSSIPGATVAATVCGMASPVLVDNDGEATVTAPQSPCSGDVDVAFAIPYDLAPPAQPPAPTLETVDAGAVSVAARLLQPRTGGGAAAHPGAVIASTSKPLGPPGTGHVAAAGAIPNPAIAAGPSGSAHGTGPAIGTASPPSTPALGHIAPPAVVPGVALLIMLLLLLALAGNRRYAAALASAGTAAAGSLRPTAAALPRLLPRLTLPAPLRAPVRAAGGLWSRAHPAVYRATGIATAGLLALVYIVASVSTLASVPVVLGMTTSSALPIGGLSAFSALIVSLALTAIAARYVYYYYCWYTSRSSFAPSAPVDLSALATSPIPLMKFQVTTKGGALPVVERSLAALEQSLEKHPFLADHIRAEVITEVALEADSLERRFRDSLLRVTAICLPESYETPNGTRLKARALHHLVELRRAGFNREARRTFIVHLDEETLVTDDQLLVLVRYLSGTPKPVSQGPILYPLEWSRTPWICRALESTRPFGCSECARVMENPPPPHLHGSNLVVDEDVENEVGWDFGTLDGQAYIAEDLLFGLRAYSILGKDGFGWHGATMLEQPPLSLHWAVQQRLRWVTGALQGLVAMGRSAQYEGISRWHRFRLRLAIGFRIATYSLGFPVGFAGLYFVLHPITNVQFEWASTYGFWRLLIVASAIGWFTSYQIGIQRNLRFQAVSRGERVKHGVVMFLITPIAGLCETVGPFVALLRWLVGSRRTTWTPTPKVAQPRPAPAT